MKVAVASLLQETNTFSPQWTYRDQFMITPPEELIASHRTENSELHGFIDALEERGAELVPLFGGWAVSSGRIRAADFQSMVREITDRLDKAGPLDGVLLALHGAWAGEGIDSADSYLMHAVRERIGPGIPLVATLDLHANVTRALLKNADGLIAYATSPHTDLYDTGLRGARLLIDMHDRKVRPTMGAVKVPMVVQAENMMSDRGVFREILDYVRSLERLPQVLSASLLAVQPWLDVEELGWTTLVITDNDEAGANSLAQDMARFVWARRHAFVVALPSVDQALEEAMKIDGGPIVIGEGADGTMGGAPGDGTSVLEGVLRKKLDVPVAAIVVDPEAVGEAKQAGIGQTITIDVGGKLDKHFAKPIRITGQVKLISDGDFRYKGQCYNGRLVKMGMGVVLSVGKIALLISERPVTTTDPELYRSHGIEPRDMKLVLVKSPLGMRMEYEPIAKAILIVNSPGCCSPDLHSLPFRRIPHPMFPFDEFDFSPEDGVLDGLRNL